MKYKTLLLVIVFTLLTTLSSHAATITTNTIWDRGAPYTDPEVLLYRATSTGASATIINLQVPMSNHMCMATWGGTVPTSITFSIDVSGDGVSFGTNSQTMTSSPWVVSLYAPGTQYIRGNYISKVGGDGTTSISITCTNGGN